MANRCFNCGTLNNTLAAVCSHCGASFSDHLKRLDGGIRKLKSFAILFLAASILGSAGFLYGVFSTHQIFIWVYNSFSLSTWEEIEAAASAQLYTYQFFIAASLAMVLISAHYLMSGYKDLEDMEPSLVRVQRASHLLYDGLAVVIASEVAMAVAIILIIPGLSQVPPLHNPDYLNTILGFSIANSVGGSLAFIAYFIGMHIGLHRASMALHKGRHGIFGVLYVASLIVPPAGVIAASLTYYSLSRSESKLRITPQKT